MFSACKFGAVLLSLAATVALAQPPVLRVCADSDNLPYSNAQHQGFENKLAEMVARDLGKQVRYVWWPQNPIKAEKMFRTGACDVTMEMPSGSNLARSTNPYYASTYVFVTRRQQHRVIRSFDDPYLKVARIGLHVFGDEGAFVPPQSELLRRGIVRNIVGYSGMQNASKSNPSAELIKAVAAGKVDVAIAWGPLAGYYSKHSEVPLQLQPVCPSSSAFPVVFKMAMGVRNGNRALLAQLNSEISRRRSEITTVLRDYDVPLVTHASESRACR